MFNTLLTIVRRWEFTVPNVITLARLVITLWGLNVYYWVFWSPWFLLLCCIIGGACDALDGFLARKLGQTSLSGKLLDPVVDKLCVWNGVVIIAHYYATTASLGTGLLMLLAIPPMTLIGIYDYMTLSFRGTDEKMETNPAAQTKQLLLFSSLGLCGVAIAFDDVALMWEGTEYYWVFYGSHVLCTILGLLMLVPTMRLTADSARRYLKATKDPRAQKWSEVRWVRTVLASI